MKTKLYVKDLLSDEILFNETGECIEDERMTQFVMQSDSMHSVWKILQKGLLIENHQEADVIVRLFDTGSGRARIFSPYGELEARLQDVKIIRSPHQIEVYYQIEGGQKFGFSLAWENEA